MAAHDPYVLPEGLPVPRDDGACDHLPGLAVPDLTLPSSAGPVSLAELARERLVLYVYPRTRRPRPPLAPGWGDIPGAPVEFAERNRMPFPVVSDERLELARALRLPTFEVEGVTLYKRVTLVAERGLIAKAFYPVFP